jgi:DNA-binding LacI/PurR family transcriptional regulator
MSRKRITIVDLGWALDVSTYTVSRALANKEVAAAETRGPRG